MWRMDIKGKTCLSTNILYMTRDALRLDPIISNDLMMERRYAITKRMIWSLRSNVNKSYTFMAHIPGNIWSLFGYTHSERIILVYPENEPLQYPRSERFVKWASHWNEHVAMIKNPFYLLVQPVCGITGISLRQHYVTRACRSRHSTPSQFCGSFIVYVYVLWQIHTRISIGRSD